MSLANTTSRVDYPGTGTTGPFAYPFKIFVATDLRLIRLNATTGVPTLLFYPADYSVTGVGDEAGGTVTLAAPLALNEILTVKRLVPLTQPTALQNQGPYFAKTHEKALDRIVMQVQQLQDQIDILNVLSDVPIDNPSPVATPTGLVATAISPTRVDLSWIDNATNDIGYTVERADDVAGAPGTFAEIGSLLANSTSYSDTTVIGYTKYWYRVRAHSTTGQSAYSNQSSVTTIPGTPVQLVTALNALGTPQVKWAAAPSYGHSLTLGRKASITPFVGSGNMVVLGSDLGVNYDPAVTPPTWDGATNGRMQTPQIALTDTMNGVRGLSIAMLWKLVPPANQTYHLALKAADDSTFLFSVNPVGDAWPATSTTEIYFALPGQGGDYVARAPLKFDSQWHLIEIEFGQYTGVLFDTAVHPYMRITIDRDKEMFLGLNSTHTDALIRWLLGGTPFGFGALDNYRFIHIGDALTEAQRNLNYEYALAQGVVAPTKALYTSSGNSWAVGYGLNAGTDGWMKKIRTDLGATLDVISLGRIGARPDFLLDRFDVSDKISLGNSHRTKKIVLMFELINDMVTGLTDVQIFNAYKTLCAYQRSHGATWLIAATCPYLDASYETKRLSVNAMIRADTSFYDRLWDLGRTSWIYGQVGVKSDATRLDSGGGGSAIWHPSPLAYDEMAVDQEPHIIAGM